MIEESRNILNQLLMKKLNELVPLFDSNNIEFKMYEMCENDFWNYLMVVWGKDLENLDLGNMQFLSDIEMEIEAWLSLWLYKWKQRVKILFGAEENFNRTFNQVQTVIPKNSFSNNYIKDFEEGIKQALINNGEIVGTELLSKEVPKRVLAKVKYSIGTKEGEIQFFNDCLREVKILSLTYGKLIFINVKNYKW